MVGISIEGSTPAMHRAMRGRNADLDEVIEAARLVRKEPDVGLKRGTVVSGVNRGDLLALAGARRTPDSSGIGYRKRSSSASRRRPWT